MTKTILAAALACMTLPVAAQAVTIDVSLDSTARPGLGTSDLSLTLSIDGSPLNWDFFVIDYRVYTQPEGEPRSELVWFYRQANIPAVPDTSTADPNDFETVTLSYSHPVTYDAPGTYSQIVEGDILFFINSIDYIFTPGRCVSPNPNYATRPWEPECFRTEDWLEVPVTRQIGAGTGGFAVSRNVSVPSPVPLPATALLLVAGLGGLAAFARRRTR